MIHYCHPHRMPLNAAIGGIEKCKKASIGFGRKNTSSNVSPSTCNASNRLAGDGKQSQCFTMNGTRLRNAGFYATVSLFAYNGLYVLSLLCYVIYLLCALLAPQFEQYLTYGNKERRFTLDNVRIKLKRLYPQMP